MKIHIKMNENGSVLQIIHQRFIVIFAELTPLTLLSVINHF